MREKINQSINEAHGKGMPCISLVARTRLIHTFGEGSRKGRGGCERESPHKRPVAVGGREEERDKEGDRDEDGGRETTCRVMPILMEGVVGTLSATVSLLYCAIPV